MRFPPSVHAHPAFLPTLADDGDNSPSGPDLREWSSLIGILTAIIGNILISFALNIQRYAHIRLHQDYLRRSRSWASVQQQRSTEPKKPSDHAGRQQERIAEERVEANLKTPLNGDDGGRIIAGDDYGAMDGMGKRDAEEQSPGSIRSRRSSGSTFTKKEAGETPEEVKNYLSSPYWWAGIVLMTLGEAGNFLAYGFAPASIVSPLGVVALISNCIIAPCLLKERFRRRDFLGVVVAVGGAVTICLSAKISETKMGPDDIWDSITRWEFETYLGITVAMMLLLVWASPRYGQKSILLDLGLVGLFGGYTALSTKGIASLLSDSLWRVLTFPITYLLLLILVSTAILQIRYVNKALQRFSSTQVIPTQFVLFTISVILGSAILYRDFESADAERVAKFAGGCILTFSGVYLITSGRGKNEDDNMDDEGDEDDEESMIGLVDEENHGDVLTEMRDDDGPQSRRQSVANAVLQRRHSRLGSQHLSRQASGYGQSSRPQTPNRYSSHRSSTYSETRQISYNDDDDDTQSPLMENPWLSSQERLNHGQGPQRQTLESTMSTPNLPSEAQTPHPSSSQAQLQYILDESNGGGGGESRPPTRSRNSLSRMIPGPLLPPLSSPLSAIIADNLRRGVDSPSKQQRRRRMNSLRKSRSQRGFGDSAEEFSHGDEAAADTTSPLKTVLTSDGIPDSPTMARQRARRFSTSMAGIFGIGVGSGSGRKKSEGGGGGGGGGTGGSDGSGSGSKKVARSSEDVAGGSHVDDR
ncbi:hypothetical protein MMC25_008060 [Agyrium rufum]|nr:hypothetical protein [Agyrium rufum]